MTLDQLLLKEEHQLTLTDLLAYFNEIGYDNLKSKDIEPIIKHFGVRIFAFSGFSEIYFSVTSKESDKVMRYWTKCVGWLTIAIGVMTFIMLMISIFKKQ